MGKSKNAYFSSCAEGADGGVANYPDIKGLSHNSLPASCISSRSENNTIATTISCPMINTLYNSLFFGK